MIKRGDFNILIVVFIYVATLKYMEYISFSSYNIPKPCGSRHDFIDTRLLPTRSYIYTEPRVPKFSGYIGSHHFESFTLVTMIWLRSVSQITTDTFRRQVCNKSNTTGATSRAGTAYSYRIHLHFFIGLRVVMST